MRLYSFRGTRYSGAAGRRAAPPFDQIDEQRAAELHARDECHFAHLTRPKSPEEASRLLASWGADGTTREDDSPSLYGYQIRLSDGSTRLGLCGLIAIEPAEADVIRPHESTVDKTIDERLGLLETTRTDLEPILVLCERSGEFEALLTRVARGQELCSYSDEFGHEHRLFLIQETETIERFRQILAPSPGWIADGHHRYRVASEFARRHPAEGAAAAKLAVITSLASPGLRIDPIHRAIVAPVTELDGGNVVVESTAWEGSNGRELAAAVAAAAQPAIGVCLGGSRPEIWRLDPGAAPPDLPESAAPLAAALVHGPLFERFGLGAGASHDGSVVYRSDPDELYEQVQSGAVGVGIWLPPTSPELFAGAVTAGDRLPPKWTRFVPKLASGLVWCPHEAEIA